MHIIHLQLLPTEVLIVFSICLFLSHPQLSSQQHHSESSPLWDCFCTNIQKGEGWSKKTGIINFEWQTLDVQEDVPCTPCWVSLNPNHSLLSNLISAVWLLEAQSRVKEDVSEVANGLSESYFAVSLVHGIAFIEQILFLSVKMSVPPTSMWCEEYMLLPPVWHVLLDSLWCEHPVSLITYPVLQP